MTRLGARLTARGLGVHIGPARLLSEVDVALAAGEWLTIIGPNGAGKSTLLRALAGLVAYTGTVTVDDTPIERLHRRQRARLLALVPQDPVVPPAISVLDYALLGRNPYIAPLGRESRADIEAVEAVLDRLDLGRFADRMLATLSGGERQRVYLARALAQGARLLLLDEPTGALDIGHQQEVLELVDELRADPATALSVITTMHELTVVGEYSDRVMLLADGRVAATGTPAEVLTAETLSAHYRASLRVIEGGRGPVVVPVRPRG